MVELPYDPEVLFRVFMDQSPLAAWIVDAEDRLVYASEPWPLTREQIGVPIFDLVPAAYAEPYRAALRQARSTKTAHSVIAPGPRPEAGSEATGWFQGFYFPLPDGYVGGVGLDVTELVAARDEVAESRQRLLMASDQTRRQIERDLHDGVQQQLIAQLLKLRLAQRLLMTDPDRVAQLLVDLVAGTEGTIRDLRDLARGIHPGVLTKFGLDGALKSLAGHTTISVQLDCSITGRLPEDVEVATYYLCAESLTNIAKHSGATWCAISVHVLDDCLGIRIVDNGTGGARIRSGGGLEGLQDRLAALAGKLSVSSPTAGGSIVEASVPLHGRLPGDEPSHA
jgi:signal transduction histidine kinase